MILNFVVNLKCQKQVLKYYHLVLNILRVT